MPSNPAARPLGALTAAAALSLAVTTAEATWSILIADTRTGEIVVGSATCLTNFDLARETPVILAGVGAITAQSAVDSSGRNRMFARDGLLEGRPLSEILTGLSEQDNGHNNRQYGMITALGDTLTYSGIDNADWAGGQTGRIERGRPGPLDDIVYAVQGNILSGANVVPAAVAAIEGSLGSDLPKMLMDSMIAARNAGGDGRCSCSQQNPTGCGEDIAMPFKSAHIGYMIGSRLGDVNTMRGFYTNSANARGFTTIDLDGDNASDFAVTSTDGSYVLYTNATGDRDQVSRLAELGTFDSGLASLGDAVSADLDGDGRDDLAAVSGSSAIAVMLQSAEGVFAAPLTIDLGGEIRDLGSFRAENASKDTLLAAIPDTGLVQAVSLHGGALAAQTLLDTDAQCTSVTPGDADGDGSLDLLVTLRDTDQLLIARGDGAGAFSDWMTLATDTQPQDSVAADLDGDTVPDVVVLNDGAESLQVFLGTGSGFAAPLETAIDNDGVSLQAADLDGDGVVDLSVRMIDPGFISTLHQVRNLFGDGAGGFVEVDNQPISPAAPDAAVTNLNPGFDDDTDTVVVSGNDVLLLDNDGSGMFPPNAGFAGGSHYMFFNIANQQAAAADPVDQMAERFGMFRSDLMGEIDAVRSGVSEPSRLITGRDARVTIDLRDWSSAVVDPSGVSFAFDAVSGDASATVPVKTAPGVYELDLSTARTSGVLDLEISVTDADRSVVLMPRLRVGVTDLLADLSADGGLDFSDVSAFLRAVAENDPSGDINGDGSTDLMDVQPFIDAFSGAQTAG